ncbi:uncharacterized protein AFUA_8G05920 [Aspergillus fumigatus Af293]|uniref:Uncharacterized protein n=1 Tax=Aspergillus fumigatus (strain ATCC MYA-4609 / CBS 101355 / FGSC A1100 / Af293) TaxID=330879 RepID=Q4WC28_ASPFU|nr:hypothetical protein AFUA_8G05920 [Aspergillus fumigatus Af293]EAL85356.1 hypothetical protein AFUA_8G05920 [Aspergillus fumigatus Af293]
MIIGNRPPERRNPINVQALTPTPALITIWTTARLGFRSGNEIGNGFIVLINGAVQYGIAPSILIPQLLNSHKIGELWDCNEKRRRFFGPQVIHNKLDDLSWQME